PPHDRAVMHAMYRAPAHENSGENPFRGVHAQFAPSTPGSGVGMDHSSVRVTSRSRAPVPTHEAPRKIVGRPTTLRARTRGAPNPKKSLAEYAPRLRSSGPASPARSAGSQ